MSVCSDVEHRRVTHKALSLDFSPYKQWFIDGLPGQCSLRIVATEARVPADICNALRSELDLPFAKRLEILCLLYNYGGAGLQINRLDGFACRAAARAMEGQRLIESRLRADLKI